MSDWIALKNVAAWLEARYGAWQRLGSGWGPNQLPQVLGEALRSGSIRARGNMPGSPSRQLLHFPAGTLATIQPNGDLRIAGTDHWSAEIETDSLAAYCDTVIGAPTRQDSLPKPAKVPGPGRTPKYDWPAAFAAISTKDCYEDFVPDLYAEGALAIIEAEFLEWFAAQGQTPTESLIRQRAQRWREVTAAGRQKANSER